ncbi:hypothetical protein Tco_1434810 [Tanacetum coccineum]
MKFLKRKKNDADETDEVVKIDEGNEVLEAKRTKLNHDLSIRSTNNEGDVFDEEDRVSSTNASGSKPRSNTRNDRIPRPSNCNANVKNVALSKNFDTICLSCNECLFSANHDAYVVHYLKKMQKRKVAKSAKQKVKREWKPTGQIFKTVVVPLGHVLTTTVISVDVSCPKLILRYANARESLFRIFTHLICMTLDFRELFEMGNFHLGSSTI